MEPINNTFTVPCEKLEMFFFAYSMMGNIVVFPSFSRFTVKLICCIAFESESSSCCLLKSIAII